MVIPSPLRYLAILALAALSRPGLLPAQAQPQPQNEELSTQQVFALSPFDRWMAEGPVEQIPWKVKTFSHGLSLHQRMVQHIEVELHGREAVKRSGKGSLVLLVQITDAQHRTKSDHGFLGLDEIKPEMRKNKFSWRWDAFVLPGEYQLAVALFDTATGEHDFMQTRLTVDGIKNDPLPELWQGLPSCEFWEAHDDLDTFFHPEISGRLNLAPATRRAVQMEVLVDLTPSDLFHGSMSFYRHYLAVVVPLMKALSQTRLSGGAVRVATVDLRRRKVTFEQTLRDEKDLDWPRIRKVAATEDAPATIDAQALQKKHENPDFLREELLRRLNTPVDAPAPGPKPLRVFVIIGSPMDFYTFHRMPPVDTGDEKDYLIYYLQYELYNPQYASGALGQVRKLLKPMPVHTIKVRSPESIRHALARVMEEIGKR